jgi:hypothetical protein
MLPFSMLSSTSTSAPRSPVVPSPPLYKSPHQCHSMGVTSRLFSYSYALFCTAKNPNSFRFISFRTLCTKHRGWGIPSFSAHSVHGACPDLIGASKSTRAFAPPDPSGTRRSTPATVVLCPFVTTLDAVDAASSISPAFATLTKNTRGVGDLFNFRLLAQSGREGSTVPIQFQIQGGHPTPTRQKC